ncbi:Kynurenine formamidase [uncultured archaeon]|nr:Kynurenine formamidase [uncultured archaeon]
MKVIDVSLTLSPNMPTYPGDPKPKFTPLQTIGKDGSAFTLLEFGSHAGTHVDAPAHFIKNATTVDAIPLEALVGSAKVFDLTRIKEAITSKDLEKFKIKKGDRILLKTRNSRITPKKKSNKKFVHLTESAAEYLAEKKVLAVGIDCLSIEKFGEKKHSVHKRLLSAGIVIIEGLNLSDAPEGECLLVCLPLKALGLDGAPARTVLIKNPQNKSDHQEAKKSGKSKH